jgi:hypothetical protein
MNPKNIIKTALKKDYDVLGVVDHNNIKGGLKTKKIAGGRLLVIPGEEIKTNYGEIIVFLSDGNYNRNLFDICERAKSMNHFIVVPHPFDYLRRGVKDNIDKVKKMDAIEVFNSRVWVNRFNLIAKAYAEKNKIPQVVGSDAHFLEEIGNATAFLECEKNIDSIFNCLKKNKLKFSYKRCSIYSHFKSNVNLPIKRLF